MEDEKMFEDLFPQNEEHPNNDVLPDIDSQAEDVEVSESECHSEDITSPAEDECQEDHTQAESVSTDIPNAETPPANLDFVKQINGQMENIVATEQRIFSEVREMHKLYHTEFAGRLKSMQDELEQYHKIDKGKVYDDILSAIARVYGNNETLADEVDEPKAKKSIKYLLMDLEDLLGIYGMTKLRSVPGDKRNPRHCQVLNRIPTNDSTKHDTIVKSYNSGFYIGNRTVIKEVVDVYIFEGNEIITETEENQNIETGENPVA